MKDERRNANISSLTIMDNNIYAAIAMALFEFQGNNVHDKESGVITIKPKHTMWDAKFQSVTQRP